MSTCAGLFLLLFEPLSDTISHHNNIKLIRCPNLLFQWACGRLNVVCGLLKVVVYPSYNDIHDIFLSEISSQRSRH